MNSAAVFGFLIIALAVSSAAAQSPSKAQSRVLELEEIGRQMSLKGETNWDELIADGAYMIAFDGSVINYKRGQTLPALPLRAFKLSEMIARDFGKTVVVTGLAEIEGETPQKQPFAFKMRFMNVWKKTDGKWKIVVSERTTVRSTAK